VSIEQGKEVEGQEGERRETEGRVGGWMKHREEILVGTESISHVS
jgi:hypothetical protein